MKKTAHHNERIGQDWQRDTLCGDKRLDADDLGQIGEGVKSDIEAHPASIRHRPLEMPAEDMAGHERIYGAQRSRPRSAAMTSQIASSRSGWNGPTRRIRFERT